MVDFIADYFETQHERRVLPEVQPGYMRKLLPETAPRKGESWENIMKDVDRAIMPGVSAQFGNGNDEERQGTVCGMYVDI